MTISQHLLRTMRPLVVGGGAPGPDFWASVEGPGGTTYYAPPGMTDASYVEGSTWTGGSYWAAPGSGNDYYPNAVSPAMNSKYMMLFIQLRRTLTWMNTGVATYFNCDGGAYQYMLAVDNVDAWPNWRISLFQDGGPWERVAYAEFADPGAGTWMSARIVVNPAGTVTEISKDSVPQTIINVNPFIQKTNMIPTRHGFSFANDENIAAVGVAFKDAWP